MDFIRRHLSLLTALLITATGGQVSSTESHSIVIRLRVDDVIASSGQQNVEIPVWLDNYRDTVAGFSVWFSLSRPDIALFRPDSAKGGLDTTGSLVGNWELVDGNSPSGFGFDMAVAGIADMPGGGTTIGIPPQESSIPLFKLVANALEFSEDTTYGNTVDIFINSTFNLSFVTSDGRQIGFTILEIIDTNYWQCTQWSGDTCLFWQRVSGPPYDSISIEIDTIIVLDTNAIEVINGSITVVEGFCGDMNGSGGTDVADLTFLVNYLFLGGPPPPDIWTADCDGSGAIDVSDLTCFVCYLFRGCPPPACDIW